MYSPRPRPRVRDNQSIVAMDSLGPQIGDLRSQKLSLRELETLASALLSFYLLFLIFAGRELEDLWLLSYMRMLGIGINFKFLRHRAAQFRLGQHSFDRKFDYALGVFGKHLSD